MRLSVSRVCARRVSSSFRSASSRVRSSEYARRSCARALGSDSIRRPGPRAPSPALARIAPSVPRAPHILRLPLPAFALEEQLRADPPPRPEIRRARTHEAPALSRRPVARLLELAPSFMIDDAYLVLHHKPTI